MPDLPDRREKERALAAALLLLFGDEYEGFRRGDEFDEDAFQRRVASEISQPLAAPYQAAGASLLSRFNVDRPIDRFAERWAAGYSRKLAKELKRTTKKRLRTLDEESETYEEDLAAIFSGSRAETIAITEVTRGISLGEGRAVKMIKRVTGKVLIATWITEEDPAVCPVCEPLHQTTPRVWSRRFPSGPPAHPRCILPGAIVEGRIAGGLKAFYSGQAREFTTAAGKKLAVTANHPVLTEAGFLSAMEVAPRQYFLSYRRGGDSAPAFSNDVKQVPSRIEDVYRSFSQQANLLLRTNATRVNLHGDGKFVNGQIEIVKPARRLLAWFQSNGDQSGGERSFVRTDMQLLRRPRLRSQNLLAFGMLPDTSLCPRCGELTFDASRSGLDAFPLDPLLLGTGADFSARVDQVLQQSERLAVFHPTAGDAKFFRKLVDGFASVVALDQIVKIRDFQFTGHVFDLESIDAWYTCNGIIVHNCRCWLEYQ